MNAHAFLGNLALVLGVAAFTTVLFQRLRQPVVLGYLLAGLIIGPHVPVPLVADAETVATLSELGVILVMFSLGLEFRLRKLIEVGPAVALVVAIEVSLMACLGFLVARLLGWSPQTSLFAGAVVAISSTTIIAKAFEETTVRGKLRELVFGILVFEDLAAVVLLAVLTPLSAGRGLSTETVLLTVGRLLLFLVAFVVGGMLLVPRIIRAIVRVGRPETILVASVGLCFVLALVAHVFGYPVALGAFLAGALAAESGEARRLMPLVHPVRDVFAAIFFVAAGMSIDPKIIAAHWGALLALGAVVVLGKIGTVGLGAFLAGSGVRHSIQAGMSLAQIGEFSFIIAALALAGKVPGGEVLYPLAVSISALTTLTTPFLIRGSARVASRIDDALPHPLQTFAALYAGWLEQLRSAPPRPTAGARIRRMVKLLALDVLLLIALIIGGSMALEPAAGMLSQRLELGERGARIAVAITLGALAAPFCFGITQLARRLGLTLAEMALPATASRGGVDLAVAPRRALVLTLQLAIVLLVGAPLVAITQPFLPAFQGLLILLALLLLLGVSFWRSAANLEGHVRAGAEMIVEVLATQSRGPSNTEPTLDVVGEMLPGLGTPVPYRLDPGTFPVGKTLAELNLRGATGATVLALTRGEVGVGVPTADEVLREGDVLALAGSREAIAAAVMLLSRPAPIA